MATSARGGIPYTDSVQFSRASASGKINEGDWLAYSGQYVHATNQGHSATWKSSGAGIAMQSNPTFDQAGRTVTASALLFATQGVFLVSAAFSGIPALGHGVYPVSTGSAIGGVTGLTGLGATWQTAAVTFGSAMAGTAVAQAFPVGTLVGSRNYSNAGTGELFVRVMPLAPDVRG
jgi:hypothetical protein